MAAKIAPASVGRDVGRYGSAIVLASSLGIVQVFIVPKKLDVAAFGAWRVFVVYAAYLGALHLGAADGAFLRWAGRPAEIVAGEWRRIARWMLALHGAIALLAAATLPFVHVALARQFIIGYAACGLAVNLTTLAGYALQAMGDFRRAGRVAVIGPALFALAVVALPIHGVTGMIIAYGGSFALAAMIGSWWVHAIPSIDSTDRPQPIALVHMGLPVLGANLAAAIALFADRVLVSVTVPFAAFALYGFASSAMVAAGSATTALSRVALSHAAHREVSERAKFVDGFHDLVAALGGVGLAGVPFFELVVARWLPNYIAALPIVRALAVGAPMVVAVHVVLVGTLQSYGLVRRQFGVELIGLVIVLSACGACLALDRPLWQVAAVASIAACITWVIGVIVVRRSIAAARMERAGWFAFASVVHAAALLLALRLFDGALVRTLVYVALAGFTTLRSLQLARAHGWR